MTESQTERSRAAREHHRFAVLEGNFPEFERRMAGLAKLAAKLDVPAPGFEITGEEWRPRNPRTQHDADRISLKDPTYPHVRLVLVRIFGEAPKVPGFRFLGRVEPSPVAGINFVELAPAARAEERDFTAFRTAAIECEHCQMRRARRAVYLIEDETTRRIFLVGRSCLKDFTGHACPEQAATFLDRLIGIGDDDWDAERSGGSYRQAYSIEAFLAVVASVIDADGWAPGNADYPTRENAIDAIHQTGPYDRKRDDAWRAKPVPEVTDAHRERAAAALAWARGLSPDPVVNRDQYLLNLRLAVEPEFVSERLGIVASVFVAHGRAVEQDVKRREREKAEGEAKPLPAFEGRAVIEGRIVSARWKETDFGETLKITVKHDDGWTVWGSCPASLGRSEADLIGKRIRFKAKVERASDRPTFGFFSRPTSAEVIADQQAAEVAR